MPEPASPLELSLPASHAGVICLRSPVLDVTHTLTAAETRAISSAVASRRQEYATGRWLAHHALDTMGLSCESILSGDNREPIWPRPVVGSITHTAGQVAVAISASPDILGVGIDLEQVGRVGESIQRKILTQAERSRLGRLDPTLIFGAKEACYKVLYPIFKEYVSFQAVEIDVSEANSTFTARYVGDSPDHALIEQARGSYQQLNDCWLTLVVLDAPTHQAPG